TTACRRWRWLKTFNFRYVQTRIKEVFQSTDFTAFTVSRQSNCFTSTTRTTCTTDTVYIVFVLHWKTEVDDERNCWYVKTTCRNVSCNQNLRTTFTNAA